MISSFTYTQTVKYLQNLANSCGYDDINPQNIVSLQMQPKQHLLDE